MGTPFLLGLATKVMDSGFFQNLHPWELFLPIGQLGTIAYGNYRATVQTHLDVGLQFFCGFFSSGHNGLNSGPTRVTQQKNTFRQEFVARCAKK